MSIPSISRYFSFSNFNQRSLTNLAKVFIIAVSVTYAVMSLFYSSFWTSVFSIATTTHILYTILQKNAHLIKVIGLATALLVQTPMAWLSECSTEEFFQVFIGTNLTIFIIHLELLFFESETGRQFLEALRDGVN